MVVVAFASSYPPLVSRAALLVLLLLPGEATVDEWTGDECGDAYALRRAADFLGTVRGGGGCGGVGGTTVLLLLFDVGEE